MEFWGHSKNDDGSGVPEPLKVHIQAVALRAARFADAFGAREQAMAMGLLHDLGKYTAFFQKRVRGNGVGRDHASIGALATLRFFKKKGLLPAMAIEGHHVGLKRFRDLPTLYASDLQKAFEADADRYTTTQMDPPLLAFQADGLLQFL